MSPKFGQIYVCWQWQSELENCFSFATSTSKSHFTEGHWGGDNGFQSWTMTPFDPSENQHPWAPKSSSFVATTYLLPACNCRPSGTAAEKPLANQIAYWSVALSNGSMHELLHCYTWHAILWSEPPCLLRVETPGRVEQDCCHRIFLRQDSMNFGLRITSFATPKGHNKFWTWNGPGGGFKTLWNILISRCKYANVHKAPYELNFMNYPWIEKWPHFFDE